MSNVLHVFQKKSKLPKAVRFGRESGGVMLGTRGLRRFYYIRDFHGKHCKYDRVMSHSPEAVKNELLNVYNFILKDYDGKK